ncbi:MAG TPA: ABC transporter ATP-binding protein [Pyrinomonadaceae bacterium]|jgi:ATP-binding cassette subfamily B protein
MPPDESHKLFWPAARAGEALEALGRESGLPASGASLEPPPLALCESSEALGRWIVAAADWLGFEAEPREVRYATVEEMVAASAPSLFQLSVEGEPCFLALLKSGRRSVSLIAPDALVREVPASVIHCALRRAAEEPHSQEVESLVRELGIPKRGRMKARNGLLGQRLGRKRLGDCLVLRHSLGANVWGHARSLRLPRKLLLTAAAYAVQYALWLLSWWLLGRATFGGQLERGWLWAWILLIITIIPFRLLYSWSAALFSVAAGGLLKQRLLYGALRMNPEEMRHEGVGHLLSRVFEGEAVESLALFGGFLSLVSVIELMLGAVVLGLGAGGALHVLLLAGWTALLAAHSWRFFRRRLPWTAARLDITHNLVEVMAGYRTRLAQEREENWHDNEDKSLESYLKLSARTDYDVKLLMIFAPRGWLILGLCGIIPAFTSGGASAESIAISLGGVLLIRKAFDKLCEGLATFAAAGIAWQQVKPFFRAASLPDVKGLPSFAAAGARSNPAGQIKAGTLVEAHDVSFSYEGRDEPALKGCNLSIKLGDRILLEGPSGGGKSTLAALLTGMRTPDAGLLLLDGLDRQTLGAEGWRRRAVSAPQFHENHILTESFAFNLLMGRRWPPKPVDVAEAEAVCRELGLGELLSRMPAGFEQMVGESGWQLSHGERSRLFIARALLQDAELVVLDESFAALDPENLRLALTCVMKRASTLVVIAHP